MLLIDKFFFYTLSGIENLKNKLYNIINCQSINEKFNDLQRCNESLMIFGCSCTAICLHWNLAFWRCWCLIHGTDQWVTSILCKVCYAERMGCYLFIDNFDYWSHNNIVHFQMLAFLFIEIDLGDFRDLTEINWEFTKPLNWFYRSNLEYSTIYIIFNLKAMLYF